LENKHFGGAFEVAEVNGPDIKAQNTFNSSPVKISKIELQASGGRLRYEAAAHSYTMLKGKLA
ncbi:MAG: alpha-N-arabinofuranosidase, partial [Bryobacterales bacterium]|nr:alpha-N-arabinofuranosidase [Bryobacterales bacterium]